VSTVVEGEAAYLAADAAVGALVTVLPYARRHPANVRHAQLWTERVTEAREGDLFTVRRYAFLLRVTWPLTSGAASAVDDQKNLEAAVDAVAARVRASSSHGGLFLAVADERPGADTFVVQYSDPGAAVAVEATTSRLVADCRWSALSKPISA
jgi:hypothetical protein